MELKGFRTIGARLLIKEEKNEATTKTGIILPGKDREPTYRGTVLQTGTGRRADNGDLIPMEVKVGDRVVYSHFSGSPICVDSDTFIILNVSDVLCILDSEW